MQGTTQSMKLNIFQSQECCRLCGTKDTISMIEFSDTYSFMGETTGILDLLKKTSVMYDVEEEFEKFMPQCICVTCFNMAVDFQVFLDAAMNNQKSFLDQIISYSKHSFVEEHKISPYSSTPNHMETIIVGNETLLKVKNINHKKLHNLTGNEIIRSNDNTVHKIKYNLQLTHKDHQHYRKKETVMKIKSNLQTGIQNFPNISTDKSTNTIENLSNSKSENDGTSKSAGIIENEDNLTSIDHHKAEKENSTKKSIACSQCNRMFHRPSELKSHILSHSNNRPHKCSMCSMSFKYQRNLKEHSSIHSENPEYICAICGMTFRQRSNLLKHENSHKNLEKKQYVCIICKKTFSQSSHLSTHIKKLHNNSNKTFSCTKCDSTLKCLSSLRRHISTVHAINSKYFCSDCSKGFNSLQNYQALCRLTHLF